MVLSTLCCCMAGAGTAEDHARRNMRPHGIVNFMPKIASLCSTERTISHLALSRTPLCAPPTRPRIFSRERWLAVHFVHTVPVCFGHDKGYNHGQVRRLWRYPFCTISDSTHCRSPLMSPPGHRRRPWRPSQGSTSRKSTQRRHPSPLHDSPPPVIAAQRDRARTMPARLSTRNAFCSSPGRRPGSKYDRDACGASGSEAPRSLSEKYSLANQ